MSVVFFSENMTLDQELQEYKKETMENESKKHYLNSMIQIIDINFERGKILKTKIIWLTFLNS